MSGRAGLGSITVQRSVHQNSILLHAAHLAVPPCPSQSSGWWQPPRPAVVWVAAGFLGASRYLQGWLLAAAAPNASLPPFLPNRCRCLTHLGPNRKLVGAIWQTVKRGGRGACLPVAVCRRCDVAVAVAQLALEADACRGVGEAGIGWVGQVRRHFALPATKPPSTACSYIRKQQQHRRLQAAPAHLPRCRSGWRTQTPLVRRM